MDTQNLRAFLLVAESGSFSLAAEQLHITQPAVSKRVALLEDQLGTPLFDREKNRMQLTAAGRRFLGVVQKALDSLQEGALQLNPESLAGELVVAITPTVSPRASRMKSLHPRNRPPGNRWGPAHARAGPSSSCRCRCPPDRRWSRGCRRHRSRCAGRRTVPAGLAVLAGRLPLPA